jgi:hypothetical protein
MLEGLYVLKIFFKAAVSHVVQNLLRLVGAHVEPLSQKAGLVFKQIRQGRGSSNLAANQAKVQEIKSVKNKVPDYAHVQPVGGIESSVNVKSDYLDTFNHFCFPCEAPADKILR